MLIGRRYATAYTHRSKVNERERLHKRLVNATRQDYTKLLVFNST